MTHHSGRLRAAVVVYGVVIMSQEISITSYEAYLVTEHIGWPGRKEKAAVCLKAKVDIMEDEKGQLTYKVTFNPSVMKQAKAGHTVILIHPEAHVERIRTITTSQE